MFSKFTGREHSLYIIFRYFTVLKGHSCLLSYHCLLQPPIYAIFLRFSCSRYSIKPHHLQTRRKTECWHLSSQQVSQTLLLQWGAAPMQSQRGSSADGEISVRTSVKSRHASCQTTDPLAGVTPGLSQTLGMMESGLSSQSYMATPTVCGEAPVSIASISWLHTSQQELTMACHEHMARLPCHFLAPEQ